MNSSRRIIIILLLLLGFCLNPIRTTVANEAALPGPELDYGVIAGQWQRVDGGYLITVSDVQTDGRATVAYFNPHPIHIKEAAISTQKRLIKLYIKFQDKGYEGSTYTLYYFAEKDALVGFYYQALMDKTYEVIFTRKK